MITKNQVKALDQCILDKNFHASLTYLHYDAQKKRVVCTTSMILITIDCDFWEKDFYINKAWIKRIYNNFSKNTEGVKLSMKDGDVCIEYINWVHWWVEKTKLLIEDYSPVFEGMTNKFPVVDIEAIAGKIKEHWILCPSKHLLLFHKLLIDLEIPQFTSRDHVLMAQHEWVTILSRHTKID
jgi:hypothetical protein